MMTRFTALRARVGNASLLTCGEFINKASRFLLLVLLARAFGASEYGIWVLAATSGMILTSGGDLGLSTVIARRIGRTPEDADPYVRNLLVLTPTLVALVCSALLIAGIVLHGRMGGSLLVPLGIAGMLESAALLLVAPLRGLGRSGPEAFLRALKGASTLAAGALLLAGGAPLATIAWMMAACAAMSLAGAAFVLVRRFGVLRPHIEVRVLGNLLTESLPVAVAAITVLVYFRIDAFLVAWFRGSHATGVYGAAYSVAFGLTFVAAMFQRAYLPTFAAARSDAQLKHELWRRARTSGAAAVASTAFLVALTPVISGLYGSDFADMRTPYLILACAQGVFFLNNLAYTVLLARGRSGVVWMLAVLRLAGNVGANLVLIPIFGVAGAALGASLAEVMLLATQSALIRQMLRRGEPIRTMQPASIEQPASQPA